MRTEESERLLGQRIRALRVGRRLTQTELAALANVSVGALKHLESGAGSTITTLVKTLRALGQERWLDALGPAPEAFNPLALLDGRRQAARISPPTRVRHHRAIAP